MKRKTNNSTDKKKKVPSNDRIQEMLDFQVYDIFTMKQKPLHPDTIINLGMKFLKHCAQLALQDKPGSTRPEDFFRQEGYYRNDVKRWCEKLPKFKMIYEEGVDILGCIRINRADENKMNWSSIKYYQHMFGERWKKADEHWSAINDKQEKQPTTFAVHMDGIRVDKPKEEGNDTIKKND